VHEVEEVMRSCGGAIQGIREVPLSLIFAADEDISDVDRTYHNRADGGFVYADDGSYSAGPEQWDWNVSDKSRETISNANFFMASLAFPDRRRVWLTTELSEASVLAKSVADERGVMHQVNPRVLELARPVSTLDESYQAGGSSIEVSPSQLEEVKWKVKQRVRMPNTNQAWSLARAKWEKQSLESGEVGEEGDATTLIMENMGPMIACLFIESFSDKQENNIFGDVVANDAVNVHMLALEHLSRVVRSVVRCYDANGSLKSVAFLDGFLPHGGDKKK